MNRILFAAALACLSGAALAGGGNTGGHEHRAMGAWDTNHDGSVTRDEAQAAAGDRATKQFDALDKNKDGVLTQDELKEQREERHAAMQERFDERFKSADTNGDGAISQDEANKGMPMLARHFTQIDTNKDGTISREELQAQHGHMKMKRKPAG